MEKGSNTNFELFEVMRRVDAVGSMVQRVSVPSPASPGTVCSECTSGNYPHDVHEPFMKEHYCVLSTVCVRFIDGTVASPIVTSVPVSCWGSAALTPG
jgi:hypothetical protein